jgi:hypothetical protein
LVDSDRPTIDARTPDTSAPILTSFARRKGQPPRESSAGIQRGNPAIGNHRGFTLARHLHTPRIRIARSTGPPPHSPHTSRASFESQLHARFPQPNHPRERTISTTRGPSHAQSALATFSSRR